MLHQEPGATLVTGVRLPLLEVDRLRPAELPGVHDLVVPVRPLDQPDRHRRAPVAGPRRRGHAGPPRSRAGTPGPRFRHRASRGTPARTGPCGRWRTPGPCGRTAPCRRGHTLPASRAVRRIGRSRAATRSHVVSAWSASNRAVRLVSLSERFARGIGPWSSRSIWAISGSSARGPASPRSRSRQVCW